ncbi:hypothetical protein [Flavobacterium kingsejongi]|uniref:Uncharacterized protein n=1 Tax=Flavobacterium kingsejongi TaxID=1678728 RepID=A0A2S1LLX6_9FLAO|nr:hypothetical protein [Flavobacterium kingsejongi]AWG24744.1 hypothetical protein FK004_05630 [Flavobacterium kingsejongi]
MKAIVTISITFLLSLICHSQEKEMVSKKSSDTIYILLELDDPEKSSFYSFSKDSTLFSFGIYTEKYETQIIRQKKTKNGPVAKKQLEWIKKHPPKQEKPLKLYYYFVGREKPNHMQSITNIPFVIRKEFINGTLEYDRTKNYFIIHRSDKNDYLLWNVQLAPWQLNE